MKNKSHKTISNEKSDITRSSPTLKKLEETIKKANKVVQNAKTSISNPVNRLSTISELKNNNLLAEGGLKPKKTPEYPMSAEQAKKHFKLNDYEI